MPRGPITVNPVPCPAWADQQVAEVQVAVHRIPQRGRLESQPRAGPLGAGEQFLDGRDRPPVHPQRFRASERGGQVQRQQRQAPPDPPS
jgi:hypothetical protein